MKAQSGKTGSVGGKKRTSVPSRVSKTVLKNSSTAKTYRNPTRIIRDEGTASQRGYSGSRYGNKQKRK